MKISAVSKKCIKEETDDDLLEALISNILIEIEKFAAEYGI